MEKESLDKLYIELIEKIDSLDINKVDKLELLMNMSRILNNYDESIKVLREHEESKTLRKGER